LLVVAVLHLHVPTRGERQTEGVALALDVAGLGFGEQERVEPRSSDRQRPTEPATLSMR
jgi:hypothetical protein